MAHQSPPGSPVVTRIPLTEARAKLGALIERLLARGEEYFVLEKDGQPVAALIGIDEFEDYLELNDPGVIEAIAQSREEYLAGESRPAEELLRELEAEDERERQPETTAR